MHHSFFLTALVFCLSVVAPRAHAVTCAANMPPPSNPDSAYTQNGDDTVTHNPTGLVWKRCAEGQTWTGSTCGGGSLGTYTWAQALTQASNSSFAGQNDWRLPNVKELRTLVEECRRGPSINDTIFPTTPAIDFWSGSTSPGMPGFMNSVEFFSGTSNGGGSANRYAIRLVRGGQSYAAVPLLNQSITWGPTPVVAVGATATVSATATSELTPVIFSVEAFGVRCTLTNRSATSATVTGVSAGTCVMHADQAGNYRYSPAGQGSMSFTVTAIAPTAPTSVSVATGPGQAIVSFGPPTSTGGAPIQSYTATCTAGAQSKSATGAGSPLVVAGLTAGVLYSCSVTANNGSYSSAASASATVTPGKAIDITPILMLLLLDDNSQPTVTAITPTTATVSVATTFTVAGQNLPQTAVLSIADGTCDQQSYTNRSSYGFTLSCTPGAPVGSKVLTVKTNTLANGGTVIDATRSVVVTAAASKYTKLDANGNPLPASATAWSCVKDSTTGLTWEVKTPANMNLTYSNFVSTIGNQHFNYGSPIPVTQAQVDASTNYIGFKNATNATGLCGYSDWHLPTQAELLGIVDVTHGAPTIDTAYFPNTSSSYHRSSTPYASLTYSTFIVSFITGIGTDYGYREGYLPIRLVR